MKYRLFIGLLSLFLFLCNSSVEQRYKVRSFFFDGVPVPPSMQQRDISDIAIDSEAVAWDSLMHIRRLEREAKRVFHTPYMDKMCLSCHKNESKVELKKPNNVLCFDCHEDFKNPSGYVHGVVAVGNCGICHDPHFSLIPMRLIREGDYVCTYCHVELDTTSVEEHKKVGIEECIVCHNSHFSEDNKFFVKKNIDSK